MMLASLWVPFAALGLLWRHFGITLGSLWGDVGITLGSLCGSGLTWASRWRHFGVHLRLSGHFGVTIASRWGHFGVALASLWDPVAALGSPQGGYNDQLPTKPARPLAKRVKMCNCPQNKPRRLEQPAAKEGDRATGKGLKVCNCSQKQAFEHIAA